MSLFPRGGVVALTGMFAMPALAATSVELELSRASASETLARAVAGFRAFAIEGGYGWRVSADRTEQAGEVQMSATQIWVQPPGTPAVGMAFLRAYEVTGDEAHLSAARDAADALAFGQLESGGWDYLVEFDPAKRAAWKYRLARGGEPAANAADAKNVSTYDDDNTQSVLRFLLAFMDAAAKSPDPRDARIADALGFGLEKLLEAQYPNGAWPQRWDGRPRDPAAFPVKPASYPVSHPREQPKSGYFEHYTLNDNTHRDAVQTLLDAHRRTGRPLFLAAAKRAMDFLLLAQMPEPQPAWAQQYDAAMHPAWARAFEPASITCGESVGVVRLLIDMYLELGDARYLEAAAPVLAWWRRSEIAPGRWARLYELETNRPIYGDRDGLIHYTLAELTEERRTGYGWEGDFGVPEAIEYYERVVAAGRDAWLAKKATREQDAKGSASRARVLESRARAAMTSLDDQGRWLSRRPVRNSEKTEWIDSRTFILNLEVLCDYLEAAEK